jgi:hypothetical protein
MHDPMATTLHEGAVGELGIRVPETSLANLGFPWHEPTQPHERSRTTREQTVQLTLVASVSTKLLPYVQPQLTGAAAKDWWMAAYKADPDFTPQRIAEFVRSTSSFRLRTSGTSTTNSL